MLAIDVISSSRGGIPCCCCCFCSALQSCLTLCDPTGSSPPGSSVPGTLQARPLEWAAISFPNACKHAKLLQSCPNLCDSLDSSPPGSSAHGILQARILLWVAISFSKEFHIPYQIIRRIFTLGTTGEIRGMAV